MKIITEHIPIKTRGNADIADLTRHAAERLAHCGLGSGTITFFIPGSTAAITTIEYEPGLLRDIPELFDQIAPAHRYYHHDETWHDGNGYAHVRAALLGPSLVVPFRAGQMLLGTWQQIVLIDFDNRPRNREVILQIMGA